MGNSLFPAVAVNRLKYIFFFYVCFGIAFKGHSQEDLLKRKITIQAGNMALEQILFRISEQAAFTYSYDVSIFSGSRPVSIDAREEPVKSILDNILPADIEYNITGNHLILLKKTAVELQGKKEKVIISGHVYHSRNNRPVSHVVVYEVSSLISTVTNEQGFFSLMIPHKFDNPVLSFNSRSFRDTLIFVAPENRRIALPLTPATLLKPIKRVENLSTSPALPVESLPLVRRLVPEQMMVRTAQMNLIRSTFIQSSLLPEMGTNLKMSGLVENKVSINILAGYAYGVDAFELGGLVNIIRMDVNGFQIAGVSNIVGNDTRGLQIAGVFNNSRSLSGFQVSGVHNTLIDSLHGVQIAGISNILKGGMQGFQIAGVSNITCGDILGVQIAGVTNTAGNVEKLQLAGVINFSQNVAGMQWAGVANFATGNVQGLQFAGLINKAKNTEGSQVAAIANLSTGQVSGSMIGLFNYAKYTRGRQIGLFNIADSVSRPPIGMVTFVKNGFRQLEMAATAIIPANISFKTGVRKFYNIFSAGFGSWSRYRRWRFGYGFGAEKQISEKLALNLEYTANWVTEGGHFQKELSLLNRLDISMEYDITGDFSFSIGPTINFWLSEWRHPETGEYLTRLAPYTLVDRKIGTTLTQMWIGAKTAIRWQRE